MSAVLAVGLMSAASVGMGAALLRLARVDGALSAAEVLAWSFALGSGALGWAVFPLALIGQISAPPLVGLCLLGCCGLICLRRIDLRSERFDGWSWLLLATLGAVFAADFLEGISPPADADSLAYHFAIPKLFLESGHLVFIPRALDGAAPLLQQMTYMAALQIGGERAMTLWCLVSSWGCGALVYAIGRRWLTPSWSLLAALIVMTTPVMVYAGGTGQVEPRTAMFVLVAAFAGAAALTTGWLGFSAIAGIAAGFFCASKFPGLIFAASCGVVLVLQRRWFAHAAVFGLAVGLAGFEWYGWNWWNTGDPVFPMLYGVVPYTSPTLWNSAQDAFIRGSFFSFERVVPRSLWGLVIYPVLATFNTEPIFEAGRTGFGPYVLLVAPFILAGIWCRRREIAASQLSAVMAICLGFYTLWFFMGASQRIRHLLPLYPVIVLAATVAFQPILRVPSFRAATLFAVTATALLQLAAQGIFSLKFIRYATEAQSRNEFLLENVNQYAAVPWINSHLTSADKILIEFRDLVYLIDVPVFYAHPDTQVQIEIRPDMTDARLFWRQLHNQGVTHILTRPFGSDEELGRGEAGGINVQVAGLIKAGCTRVAAEIPTLTAISSRTLGSRRLDNVPLKVLALKVDGCLLAKQ